MKKVLVVDNYDSFTYNLVHLLNELGASDLMVFRNDKFKLEEVSVFNKIVLSPGPGLPSEAGLMPELVKKYSATKSILGVCLGHQCIGECFGAKLTNLQLPMHGKASEINVNDQSEVLFSNLPNKLTVGRYHSWVVDEKDIPECLHITAADNTGHIMALRHKSYDVRGVQFHPESVMTEHGKIMLKNWLDN